MKGFFRGVLALTMMVSLAFNGAMYCALQESGEAQRQAAEGRDASLQRAQQAEEALREQEEAAALAQAQLSLVQETLAKREEQLGQLQTSMGEAAQSEQALKEALSDRLAELETLRGQLEASQKDGEALAQALEEREGLAQSAEELVRERDGLSAQVAELEEQLAQACFGQEDRVQAIAALQKQLSERGELLERAEAEAARLEEQLTRAEEKNAGQAVLLQESDERERLAQTQAQALREQLEAMEAQLTAAEENYGGASVTLSEQAAELEAARQQVATLEKQLSQEAEPLVFAGREIELTFSLPEGMLAAEYQGKVYLSRQEVQGVLRELPLPGGAEEESLGQALEQTLSELYAQEERPPVTALENGYRFPGPEDGARRSVVCVLRSGEALYCLKLEGEDASLLEETADALQTVLAGSPR